MISIGRPYVYKKGNKAFLKAPVHVSDDTVQAYMRLQERMHKVHWRLQENYPPREWKDDNAGLWFSVDEQYEGYLCTESADAFVSAMLWYAMVTGSDIISEAPISQKMQFSINHYLIPALCTEKNGYRRISVSGPTVKACFPQAKGVGTGMSCGVDSMYTLHEYMNAEPAENKLTHLAYFNMGAIFHPDNSDKRTTYTIEEFYKKTDEMSEEKMTKATEVANMVNLPLIYVSSNMDSDYYRGAYGYTAVYRNCSCILALQKLFRTYYCSSAGWPDYFDLSLSEGSEHYEMLLCQSLSTESCTFILSDYVTRIEKTEAIADWDVAWNYLDVCFNFRNCGRCAKCYRTLLTLDLMGKVDNFSPVFDVDAFRRDKNRAYGWLSYARLGDAKEDNAVFARDIYEYAKKRNIKIPMVAFLYAAGHGAKVVAKKMLKR